MAQKVYDTVLYVKLPETQAWYIVIADELPLLHTTFLPEYL